MKFYCCFIFTYPFTELNNSSSSSLEESILQRLVKEIAMFLIRYNCFIQLN